MTEIGIDSFSLLEHMVRTAEQDETGALKFTKTIGEAAKDIGIRSSDRAKTVYTKDLRDSGIIRQKKLGYQGKNIWYIDLTAATDVEVRGIGNLAELLPSDKVNDSTQVVDLTAETPEEAPTEMVTEGASSVTLEDDLSRVSNIELASAIARELFDRLDAAEKRVTDEDNTTRTELMTELEALRTRLEAEVAARTAADVARREAERAALDNKMQKERLETQYAQMMKELASAKDGEEITAAARRFLRPGADGARRVAAASNATGK